MDKLGDISYRSNDPIVSNKGSLRSNNKITPIKKASHKDTLAGSLKGSSTRGAGKTQLVGGGALEGSIKGSVKVTPKKSPLTSLRPRSDMKPLKKEVNEAEKA